MFDPSSAFDPAACSCEEHECANVGVRDYHHAGGGCLDCDCTSGHVPVAAPSPAPTVKRATLWDGVADTFQTEAEMNGFRATQGRLL